MQFHLRHIRIVMIVAILFQSISKITFVTGTEFGKVILIKDREEIKIPTKICHSGIFLNVSAKYDCACVTGVWVFYPKFCEKPFMIVGGRNYCFRINNYKLKQAAIVGSYSNPFTPTITHFNDNTYSQMTHFIKANQPTSNTYMDALGAWITISNNKWTLTNDQNESICLQPKMPSEKVKRIFCRFDINLGKELSTNNKTMWNIVKKVKPGCFANWTAKADGCYPIRRENDKKIGCSVLPKLEPCPDEPTPASANKTANTSLSANKTANTSSSLSVQRSAKLVDPVCFRDDKVTAKSDDIDHVYFPLPPKRKNLQELTGRKGEHTLPYSNKTAPTTQAPSTTPEDEDKCNGLTRKSVMAHWVNPGNNECAGSINEAIFTDQLRRYAVTRFNKAFDSRLQSLEQMHQILETSRDILKKTCGKEYAPPEFLDVAAEAFFMFVQEDFFYGPQGIDLDTFDRIMKSLKKCWKRAKIFVFEDQPMGCDLRKINKTLVLPGKKVNITVPLNGKSTNFETLIETSWKMFLNAHSYCFDDFLVNDHHLFSVQFMELFSQTIYEKWIEPLSNKELYKFILPHYSLMKEIMENIEICVAAAEQVSSCPVWLQRSSPLSKRYTTGKSISLGRKKRSTWEAKRDEAREESIMWKGKGYCLQHMDEPASSLHLASCKMIY